MVVSNTSVGRKFAPVEGLSHDLVCTGSIYHVHFAWQVWHGQLSPRFKFNKLKSFSGVEIDQNHVDKRILRGKGFAVGRVKRHNFCPASVFFIFTSVWGRFPFWRSYFSNGLVKPPTTVAPFFWGGKFLQASPPFSTSKFRRQILEGLDFLHSEKIVHRDVKGVDGLLWWWWCWRKGGGLKSRNFPREKFT